MPRPTKYDRLCVDLRERIASGHFAPGAQLPSEAALCAEHGLSRSCVRKALQTLKAEGMIVSQRGQGCFVAEREREAGADDLTLMLGINFPDWNLTIAACMLYSLLEQEVVHQGRRFCHVQLQSAGSFEALMDQIIAAATPQVVVSTSWQLPPWQLNFILERLHQLGKRVVMTGFSRPAFSPRYDLVYADWVDGTREASRYLLNRHQRVVFAGYDSVDWSEERCGVFLATLRQAGRWPAGEPAPIVPYPEPIQLDVHGRPTSPVEVIAAANLADYLATHQVDAVLCANDKLVLELAKRVPLDQLPELVGYDNSIWSAEHGVPSVGLNMRRHVDLLLDRLAQPAAEMPLMIGVPTVFTPRHRWQR